MIPATDREPSVEPAAPRSLGGLEGKTPVVVFLLLALSIGSVGYAIFAHLEAAIRQEKYRELGAVGDLKVSQIVGWLGERRGDALATTRDPILTHEVERWLQRGAPQDEAARRIESRLQGLREAYRYDKVVLLDREARQVLVAGDALHRHAHAGSDQRALEAMNADQPLLSDLHLEPETDGAPAEVNIDLYAPLREAGRRVLGAVYFQIDPYRFLFRFVQSWPTPSNSAETLLVRRDGDDVLYLNELRHRRNSALRFRLPLNTPDLPAARSLRGETGVVEGVDYRGVPVLAALRTVPGSAWHLVAKIDRGEVFAQMRDLAIGVGAMVAVLIAGSGLLVALWWRRQHAQVLAMHFKAELEREALSKHLDLMSRHANDAIFLYDEAGRILEANERAVERYGYPRGELIGMSAKQLRSPHAASQGRAGAKRADETGSHIYETTHRRKDGSEFPVEASLRVVEVEGRRLTQGIVRDITERKRAQEAILQERNFIATALDSLPGLFYLIDDQGRFLRWNRNFEMVSGYSSEEISRMNPTDFLAGPDKGLVAERVKQVFLTGDATAEADFVAKDRTSTPYYFTGKLVRIDQKLCLVGMGIDISARKRAEARIARLASLKEALSGVNHAIVHAEREQPLFDQICSIMVERAGFDSASIGIADPETGDVIWAAYAGAAGQGIAKAHRSVRADRPEGRGPTGTAIREGRHVVCQDFVNDPSTAPWHAIGIELGIGSTASFPILRAGKAVGVINVDSRARNAFDDEMVALLDEAAQDVSFALDNIDREARRRQAEDRVRRLNRVYAVLSGINALIVRVRDRDELFREACRVAVEAGAFRMAWLGVVDREAMQVKPVAWYGTGADYIQMMPVRIGQDGLAGYGMSGQVVAERRPIAVDDMTLDARILLKKEARERGFHSLAILPLLIGGEAPGVLALYAGEVGFFDEDEMKLLTELAGDISFALDHIEKANRLDYLAYYDALTGLANRTLFHERLKQFLQAAQQREGKLALALLNVERFKAINDSLGRQAGDELLKQLAGRLGQAADPGCIARTGSDHFAIVLPEVKGRSEVARGVERIWRECFARPFQVGGTELRGAAKVGIALFPSDGADAAALVAQAEAALKEAQQTGERSMFHSRDLTAGIAEQLTLENKLRQALEKDEFVLHYQPKVELVTRRIVGAEALIRWQSPELGLVPPLKFIPLMEETGLILEVGAWALQRASLDHRRWTEQGLKAPRVSVNVSAVQLRRRDFVATVEEALKHGVMPTGIDLEITESLIMEDVKASIEKLTTVRGLGVSLAIDDFGTGYSSLGYLAKLPVQTLKIDRSFIIAMLNEPDAMTLVSTIISLAHSLGLRVVAEGVDAEEQAKMLRLLRCDEMQGYLVSKPVPFDAVTALLTQGREA